jgi:cytochrome c-type biogenesis protein CcmE
MTSRARTRLIALAALAVAGAALAFIAFGGLGENLIYYWGPSELHAAGPKAVGATVRLGGQVAAGTLRFDAGASTLDFAVTDGKATVPVHSSGVPPQMFREGIGVIVEGTLRDDGTFQSQRLMVSHGNEYRAPKPGDAVDVPALMQTARPPADEAPKP